MITDYMRDHVFMCSILLFGVCSIFMQWMVSIALKGYVKASANMKTTKKKVMIHLKNQFEAIYDMKHCVHNVSAYVDKYLLKLRFLGVTFSAWEKLPVLSAGILCLMAGGMAFHTYNIQGAPAVYVEILFSAFVVLACFFLTHHILGVKSKKQQIQIQLVDYLENYLANRMMRVKENEVVTKVGKEQEEPQIVETVQQEVAISKEQSDIELLEEFVQSFLA